MEGSVVTLNSPTISSCKSTVETGGIKIEEGTLFLNDATMVDNDHQDIFLATQSSMGVVFGSQIVEVLC